MDLRVDYRPPVLVGWEGPGGADERERVMRAVRAGVRRGMAMAAAATDASGGPAPAPSRNGATGLDPAGGLLGMPSYQGDGESIAIPVSVPADAAPAAPPRVAEVHGTSGYIRLDHYAIPVSPASARQYMRVVALKEGVAEARYLAAWLRMQRSSMGIDGGPFLEPTPQMLAAVKVYDAVNDALEAELRAWDDFLDAFERRAREAGLRMLAFSEKVVAGERDRYGLTVRYDMYTDTSMGTTDEIPTYGMAENQATTDLASAARQLLDALGPLEKALEKRQSLQVADLPGTWEFDIGDRPVVDEVALAAAEEEVRRTHERYNVVRNEKEILFPVLASFTDYGFLHTYELKKVRRDLEKVARGAKGGPQTVGLVARDVFERLEHIEEVRRALKNGRLNIWAADNLIAVVKAELGLPRGSLADKIVEWKVDKDASDKSLRDMLIGLVAFGLGLLAAPLTGGGSLAIAAGVAARVGSVAISTVLTVQSVREHLLAKAVSATDFDKARLLSTADPSLFWLALDIVGVIGDIDDAVKAFRNLAKSARLAVEAGDDAARAALDALETEARTEGANAGKKAAPQLGEAVRRAAEQERQRVLTHNASYGPPGQGTVTAGPPAPPSKPAAPAPPARPPVPPPAPPSSPPAPPVRPSTPTAPPAHPTPPSPPPAPSQAAPPKPKPKPEIPPLTRTVSRGKAIVEEAQMIVDAWKAGRTLDKIGGEAVHVPWPQHPTLVAAMERMAADVHAYKALRHTDPAAAVQAVDALQRSVSEGGEVLRSFGRRFESTTTGGRVPPSRPASRRPVPAQGTPAAAALADADAVRTRLRRAGMRSASPKDLFDAMRFDAVRTEATGVLGESLSRRLPGVGLEKYSLSAARIGELPTRPAWLAQRLSAMVRGWERAHLIGPGFGGELFEGLMLAPWGVNQIAQNKGVEAFLRAAAKQVKDVRVTATARGRRLAIPLRNGSFEYVDVLESVRYRIPRGDKPALRFEINVQPDGSWRIEHNLPPGAIAADVPMGGSR